MRNYFKMLNIPTVATRHEVAHALRPGSERAITIQEKHQKDALEVMMSDQRREVYADTVKLYNSLHQAQHCLSNPIGMDTHQWGHRLKDFDSAAEEADADLL